MGLQLAGQIASLNFAQHDVEVSGGPIDLSKLVAIDIVFKDFL